jgi:hypothetical protein
MKILLLFFKSFGANSLPTYTTKKFKTPTRITRAAQMPEPRKIKFFD